MKNGTTKNISSEDVARINNPPKGKKRYFLHRHNYKIEKEYYSPAPIDNFRGSVATAPYWFYTSKTTIIYKCECGKRKKEEVTGKAIK